MSQHGSRILFAVLSLTWTVTVACGQDRLTAKASSFQPQPAAITGTESDRTRDGLIGPVRRIRTEVAKISTAGGKTVEDGKRALLETAEYDLRGTKTQNQYFPITGSTLTGREVYKYDDKGNISEMTLVNTDGSLVSKEEYKYDYDSVGNWVKMTTSVAVVENGRIDFEPTEATYRTIFYYLDATMAKMVQPTGNSSPATANEVKSASSVNVSSNKPQNESKNDAPLPAPSSVLDKLKTSPVQPVGVEIGGAPANVARKAVVVAENDPPPVPRPLLRPVSGGVLNGTALHLPAPTYPDVARRMRVAGLVEVEVVVDETGKVISARALSGAGTLRDAAVQAAYRARFSPTKLSGQPVKVSGQIKYNFTLPQ